MASSCYVVNWIKGKASRFIDITRVGELGACSLEVENKSIGGNRVGRGYQDL